MKCKFCGAEVKLGERCQYCGSVAEAFYYKSEEPPEVVGKNLTDQKEYTVQKGDSLWRIAQDYERAKAVQKRSGRYRMALYKQAGNSIAVPIFESMFRKIILHETA